jgi:hypothetical protein
MKKAKSMVKMLVLAGVLLVPVLSAYADVFLCQRVGTLFVCDDTGCDVYAVYQCTQIA